MSTKVAEKAPEPGQIQIYDNALPDLKSDTKSYTIGFTQTVGRGTEEQFKIGNIQNNGESSFSFWVDGPQFELAPGDVLACNPPANATEFPENRLPHIALKRRTLPWERNGLTGADASTPWVALLVLNDSEANQFKLVRDQSFTKGKIPAGLNLDPAQCTDPAIDMSSESSVTCDQLFIETHLLKQVIPDRVELFLLCHVRQANLDDQQVRGDEDGFYSVVIANRLPAPGARATVCLVSLEGHNDSIWQGQEVDVSEPGSSQKIHLLYHRLIVLWSWTYTVGSGGDFQGIMNTIIKRKGGEVVGEGVSPRGGRPAIQRPNGWSKHVADMLGEKAALPGVARFTCPREASATFKVQVPAPDGFSSPGLYHGPLIDKPASEWRPLTPVESETKTRNSANDAVLRNASGTQAVGYASAFELGRLLTLSRQSALSALVAFREAPMLRSSDSEVRRRIATNLEATTPGDLPTLLRDQLRKKPLSQLRLATGDKAAGGFILKADPSGTRHLKSLLETTARPSGTVAGTARSPVAPRLTTRSAPKDVSAETLDGLFGALIPDATSDETGG